jgi:hypothetical protein
MGHMMDQSLISLNKWMMKQEISGVKGGIELPGKLARFNLRIYGYIDR